MNKRTIRPKIILIAYALSGFAAIALEVLWTRILIIIIGGSTYAFSLVLANFLFGIFLGSAFVSYFIDKKRDVFVFFVITQILIGLFVVLSLPFFTRLPYLFSKILVWFNQSFWLLLVIEFFFFSLVIFIPTFLMGIAFPLAVKIYKARGLGSQVGQIYGANTIGGVLGSVAAGFLLIPWVGLQKSIVLAGLIYFIVAALVFCLRPAKALVKVGFWLAVLGAGILGLFLPPWDMGLINSGVFIYADTYLKPSDSKVIFHQEGPSAAVVVRQYGKDQSLAMQINGKIDASSHGDLGTELLSGHLPMIFHSKPERVLVIGLGSAITLGAVEQYPELKQVEAIEIEPAVIEAARLFSEHNNQALDDPRLRMIVGDGRHYLLAEEKKYDVVIAEPSNPWIAGMANLFSHEYFTMLKNRLKPDGLALQWIQLYSISQKDLKTVIRTFRSVFPHTTVWTTGLTHEDLLLVGFPQEPKIDFDLVELRFQEERVKTDLERIKIVRPTKLLGYLLLDSKATESFVGSGPLNKDDLPILEFSAPKSFFTDTMADNLQALKTHQTSAESLLKPLLVSQLKEEIASQFALRENLIEFGIYYAKKDFRQAISFLEKAFLLESGNEEIKTRLLSLLFEAAKDWQAKGELEPAIKQYQRILELEPQETAALKGLAEIYLKLGKPDQAEGELKKALLIESDDAVVRLHLGVVYAQKEVFDQAEGEFKKALKLDSQLVEAHNNLAHLYQLQGKTDEAVEEWKRSLEIKPDQEKIQRLLREIKD